MQDPDSALRLHLKRLNRLLNNGGSLSGRERNCVYLNTRNGKFAAVSAISGLDFPDDARSPAVVDWDHDGDLDLWCTNRTAPQIRMMRNDTGNKNHFVAFHLQGTRSNRDAIGARVRVSVPGEPGPLVKTLHAGEGFLGQSSKWLNFGLGDATVIERVEVRWPNGNVETFKGVTIDKRYSLTEGSADLQSEPRARPQTALQPSKLESPLPTSARRMVLSARLPMPPLRYGSGKPDEKSKTTIPVGEGFPVLINLWASWCQPCLHELTDFTDRADELNQSKFHFVAISLDDLDQLESSTSADAARILDEIDFPYSSGVADERIRNQLQQASQWPFNRESEMPVPMSFLIDGDGKLAVIYRGSVGVDQIIDDLKMIGETTTGFPLAALPFPGRWHDVPSPRLPIRAAVNLMEEGDLLDAAEFVETHQELLQRHPEFSLLTVWLGDEFSKTGNIDRALRFYQLAIARDPNNVTVLNNLAWQLAANPDERIRQPQRAVFLAEKANRAMQGKHAVVLDTLSVAYAANGQFEEAVSAAKSAERLARKQNNLPLAEKISHRISGFRLKQQYIDQRTPH